MGREKELPKTITIDGPAGAGKSTVSKLLAQRLRYLYLDTGAMYRAVALWAEREGISQDDDQGLERMCRQLKIAFRGDGDSQRIFCQGEDVTENIREPRMGWMASTVSLRRPVREAMVRLQRKIGEEGGIVAEGRDTGTVVFPNAPCKFFLTAAPEERARRRYRELAEKGAAVRLEDVQKEINDRDEQDSCRVLAPLRPARDARHIDSTGLLPEEVVERMLTAIVQDCQP